MKRSLVVAAALLLATPIQAAGPYPERPVAVIVPWAAGGAADINVRSFAEAMSKRLGQTMPILNKTGASGTIGTTQLARAAPDGCTRPAASDGGGCLGIAPADGSLTLKYLHA